MTGARNPYLIEGPALISFSGGRTSAFMLRQILDAHDGQLPDDVHVCFANTGKERKETLRFVYECGSRWNVRIRWIEFRSRRKSLPPGERYEEVGFNSASRNGEPLAALFASKQTLPNAVRRFCTAEAKVETLAAFMLAQPHARWNNVVGLRADEVRRVAKLIARNDAGEHPYVSDWPMLKAGVTSRDVWRFWLGANADPKRITHPLPQGFDLGLYPYEGNCDGCFLKGREILIHQERERPGYLDWWIQQEAAQGGTFVTEYSYAQLKAEVARQPLLLPLDWRDLEFDAECGVSGTDHRIRCGAKAA
jgi:3'-phosphoadenosine 5'-phosphosulfate sulfotransferase (PAPS reductase)/FAD synthetase